MTAQKVELLTLEHRRLAKIADYFEMTDLGKEEKLRRVKSQGEEEEQDGSDATVDLWPGYNELDPLIAKEFSCLRDLYA